MLLFLQAELAVRARHKAARRSYRIRDARPIFRGLQAIVGNDKDWTYVYTPEKGNLAMLGWAETYLYGSASISVFMESAPGSGKVDVSIFAGEGGLEGLQRGEGFPHYGLKTVHLRPASGDGIAPPALPMPSPPSIPSSKR
ncbi:MAG: hypothetical protein ACLTTU_04215 [Bilophila wadsworthia]